jgi:hypothetical protein
MSASRSRDTLPQIPHFSDTRGSKKDKQYNLKRAQTIKSAKKKSGHEARVEAAFEASLAKKAAKEQRERESWKKPKK